MASSQGKAYRNGTTFYAINLSSSAQELNGNTTRINWGANVQFGDWYYWGVRLHVAVDGVEVGSWAGACTYSGQVVINVSGSRDIGRGHGGRGVTVSAWTTSETVNGYGGVGTTTSCQHGETVNAKPAYTVSYNANGGSGAPGNQTKWYGENLTLSTGKPTRTGHNFSGWATSASGAVAYQPGAVYTGNAALTLYAKWTPHTYTVSYNANGGSGAPGNQTKTYGQTLKLSSTIPTRKNYNFLGWGTSAGSTTVAYKAGANYTANAAITLYAIWELAWLEPRITNLQATRCDSAGTLKEDGQYAKVTFKWATDRTVSSIKIVCNGVTTTPTGTGTSGSVNVVVGNNKLDTELSYDVNVTVTDEIGGVTIKTTIAPINFIMDISPVGSIGFGVPAPSYGLLSTKRFTLQGGRGHINCTGANGKPKWVRLGTIDNSFDSCSTIIDIYSGQGYNSTSNQNTWVRIFIKDGWQQTPSATLAFGATVTQFLNANGNFKIKLMASSNAKCDVWIRFPWDYWNCGYEVSTQAKWINDQFIQDSEPTNGTEQTSISYHYCGDMMLANDYYGLNVPGSDHSNWIRTTDSGLIPYSSDRTNGHSALGTGTWPFKTVWANELNWTGSGLKGRVMKKIWSGTLSKGATVTVNDVKYYNMFACMCSGEFKHMLFGVRDSNGNAVTLTGGVWSPGVTAHPYFDVYCELELTSTTIKNLACAWRAANYIYQGGTAIEANVTEIYGIL